MSRISLRLTRRVSRQWLQAAKAVLPCVLPSSLGQDAPLRTNWLCCHSSVVTVGNLRTGPTIPLYYRVGHFRYHPTILPCKKSHFISLTLVIQHLREYASFLLFKWAFNGWGSQKYFSIYPTLLPLAGSKYSVVARYLLS